MVRIIVSREADLSKEPDVLPHKEGTKHIAIGDAHGNTLKLIYTLIEEGILEFSNEKDYLTLAKIYSLPTSQIDEKILNLFAAILEKAKVNTHYSLTLIGDEMADRGQNDLYTLMLLSKLVRSSLDIDIMISNHSLEFLFDYERGHFQGSRYMPPYQTRSLSNLVELIDKKRIDEKIVRTVVERYYLPLLKLFGYTRSDKGITIFVHAPVGLETIEAVANKLGITYKDNCVDALILTIDAINHKVQELLEKKEFAQMVREEGHTSEACISPETHPLRRALWNREVKKELRTKPLGDFKVNVAYGHIGQKSLLWMGKPLPTHHNIDCDFGKEIGDDKTGFNPYYQTIVHHHTWHSSELTAKRIQLLKKAVESPKRRRVELTAKDGSLEDNLKQWTSNPLYSAATPKATPIPTPHAEEGESKNEEEIHCQDKPLISDGLFRTKSDEKKASKAHEVSPLFSPIP